MSSEPSEVVAIPFPYSDLRTSKRRPVLVLTAPDRHGDFICLAITSVPVKERAVVITSEHLIDSSLPKDSWIRCDKIFTLSESVVAKRYGKITESKWDEVLAHLCPHLGCPSR